MLSKDTSAEIVEKLDVYRRDQFNQVSWPLPVWEI